MPLLALELVFIEDVAALTSIVKYLSFSFTSDAPGKIEKPLLKREEIKRSSQGYLWPNIKLRTIVALSLAGPVDSAKQTEAVRRSARPKVSLHDVLCPSKPSL
jgi:hypothetical protein